VNATPSHNEHVQRANFDTNQRYRSFALMVDRTKLTWYSKCVQVVEKTRTSSSQLWLSVDRASDNDMMSSMNHSSKSEISVRFWTLKWEDRVEHLRKPLLYIGWVGQHGSTDRRCIVWNCWRWFGHFVVIGRCVNLMMYRGQCRACSAQDESSIETKATMLPKRGEQSLEN
jgi:hypothetical protein